MLKNSLIKLGTVLKELAALFLFLFVLGVLFSVVGQVAIWLGIPRLIVMLLRGKDSVVQMLSSAASREQIITTLSSPEFTKKLLYEVWQMWPWALAIALVFVLMYLWRVILNLKLSFLERSISVKPNLEASPHNVLQAIQKNKPQNLISILNQDPKLASMPLDDQLHTPLMVATIRGTHHLIRILLDFHANVNDKNKQTQTAIALAVYADDIVAAKLLLQSGADINVQDRWGQTPLMLGTLKKTQGVRKKSSIFRLVL